MHTAEWLFRNHLTHIAMVKLLTAQLERANITQPSELRDEEIEARVLYSPIPTGMPKNSQISNPTERVALSLDDIREATSTPKEISASLQRFQSYIDLYEYIINCLTDKEKWLVEHFFIQGDSLSRLSVLDESPFEGYARTSIWRYKEKILLKADGFLKMLI